MNKEKNLVRIQAERTIIIKGKNKCIGILSSTPETKKQWKLT